MKKRTHAKETGTLRSAGNQIREKGSKRLRHLQGGDEAEIKRQKEIGVDYPATRTARDYKQLDLLQRRDELFDTYLTMTDRLKAWQEGAVKAYFGLDASNGHELQMIRLLNKAKQEITKQLIELDERISPITLQE